MAVHSSWNRSRINDQPIRVCGSKKSLPDTIDVGRTPTTEAPTPGEQSPVAEERFTASALADLQTEAQDVIATYGFGVACLFEGDFTAGGWEIGDVIAPLGLSDKFAQPAVGTLGIAEGGDSVVSIYEADYQGETPSDMRKEELEDRICYVPQVE